MSTAPITRIQNGVVQGGYRPPQWSGKPSMISITVPAAQAPANDTTTQLNTQIQGGAGGSSANPLSLTSVSTPQAKSYIFDAVLSVDHEQTLTKTQHPVQTSASVSSHAYLNPAQVVMYVLMSDTVPSYSSGLNQTAAPYVQAWSGNPSKSVSAYQQMLVLQASRVPLTVVTRLNTYYNMIITRLSPHEDSKSITGARFRVEFEQIFIANTQTVTLSARPNDTASTGLGTVNSNAPSAVVTNQFGVPADATTNTLPSLQELVPGLTPQPTAVNVPGAGSFSSVPQQFGGGA